MAVKVDIPVGNPLSPQLVGQMQSQFKANLSPSPILFLGQYSLHSHPNDLHGLIPPGIRLMPIMEKVGTVLKKKQYAGSVLVLLDTGKMHASMGNNVNSIADSVNRLITWKNAGYPYRNPNGIIPIEKEEFLGHKGERCNHEYALLMKLVQKFFPPGFSICTQNGGTVLRRDDTHFYLGPSPSIFWCADSRIFLSVGSFKMCLHVLWEEWKKHEGSYSPPSTISSRFGDITIGQIDIPIPAIPFSSDPQTFANNIERVLMNAVAQFQRNYGFTPHFHSPFPYQVRVKPYLSKELTKDEAAELARLIREGAERSDRPRINFTVAPEHNYKILARRLLDAKSYDMALYYCEKGLKFSEPRYRANPHSIKVVNAHQALLRAKADILCKQEKSEEGRQFYRYLISLNQNTDEACDGLVNLAVSYRAKNEYEQAILNHQKAERMRPGDCENRILFGYTYYFRAKIEKNPVHLESANRKGLEALQIDSDSKRAHTLLKTIAILRKELS